MKLTLSCIKTDVGSTGGHTEPSPDMTQVTRSAMSSAVECGIIRDGCALYTGDDLALIMLHERGEGSSDIHIEVALQAFRRASDVAVRGGQHGAGQDLLKDASSGNLRGCGPGVAELTFDHDPRKDNKARPSEQVLVFMADKCGPGAYNLPLLLATADPMFNSGLLQSTAM